MIYLDDISDIHQVEFSGVNIPNDAGYFYYFTRGWRRGLLYDFSPLLPEKPQMRDYCVKTKLGQIYTYLDFHKRFALTETEWSAFYNEEWFPFVGLNHTTISDLINRTKSNWPLDDQLEKIVNEVKQAAAGYIERWRHSAVFTQHLPFFEKAIERYLEDDFISATSIIYPRIEGLARTFQQLHDPSAATSQKGLSASALKLAISSRHPHSVLFPAKFKEYLENIYFASFNPTSLKIRVSRNSVSHGVASAEFYSKKSTTIGLLIADHLFYVFRDFKSKD